MLVQTFVITVVQDRKGGYCFEKTRDSSDSISSNSIAGAIDYCSSKRYVICLVADVHCGICYFFLWMF